MIDSTIEDKALQRWLNVRVADRGAQKQLSSKNPDDYRGYTDQLSGGSPEEVGFMLWTLWHDPSANKTLAMMRDAVRTMFETTTMTDRERGMWVVMQHQLFVLSVQECALKEVKTELVKGAILSALDDMMKGDD